MFELPRPWNSRAKDIPGAAMRVLIVEDDKVLADGLTRYLQQTGYIVDAASSGTEADAVLSAEEFGLVILDIGLPEIGRASCRERV